MGDEWLVSGRWWSLSANWSVDGKCVASGFFLCGKWMVSSGRGVVSVWSVVVSESSG